MFGNFRQSVDIYCERLDPSFWAEPLNALSNFAFILAAVFTYGLWREYSPKARDIKTLIILAAIVGIGSFVFHTVATVGSSYADIIPIIIFIHLSVAVIFKRVLGLKWRYAVPATILFLILNIVTMKLFGREVLNGSITYVPTLVLLLSVGAYSFARKYLAGKEFVMAGVAFFVSITCRSIDQQICDMLPIGVHYMWHILNSVTIYYVIKGLIKTASGEKHLLRRKST